MFSASVRACGRDQADSSPWWDHLHLQDTKNSWAPVWLLAAAQPCRTCLFPLKCDCEGVGTHGDLIITSCNSPARGSQVSALCHHVQVAFPALSKSVRKSFGYGEWSLFLLGRNR